MNDFCHWKSCAHFGSLANADLPLESYHCAPSQTPLESCAVS